MRRPACLGVEEERVPHLSVQGSQPSPVVAPQPKLTRIIALLQPATTTTAHPLHSFHLCRWSPVVAGSLVVAGGRQWPLVCWSLHLFLQRTVRISIATLSLLCLVAGAGAARWRRQVAVSVAVRRRRLVYIGGRLWCGVWCACVPFINKHC